MKIYKMRQELKLPVIKMIWKLSGYVMFQDKTVLLVESKGFRYFTFVILMFSLWSVFISSKRQFCTKIILDFFTSVPYDYDIYVLYIKDVVWGAKVLWKWLQRFMRNDQKEPRYEYDHLKRKKRQNILDFCVKTSFDRSIFRQFANNFINFSSAMTLFLLV